MSSPQSQIVPLSVQYAPSLQVTSERCWVEISASAFNHNIACIKQLIKESHLALVVKSNAYGHGLALMGSLAHTIPSIHMLCTATLKEAALLRSLEVTKPILVLYDTYYDPLSFDPNTHLGIYNFTTLNDLIRAADLQGKKVPIHLKIDTGMTRLGIHPEDIDFFLRHYSKAPISLEGIFTHLADKDNPDTRYTLKQLEIFERVVLKLKAHGYHIPFVHALSSGALQYSMHHPLLTMVRAGTNCYGLTSTTPMNALALKPILSWKTKITAIKKIASGTAVGYNRTFVAQKPTTLALLPIGYADGLPRALSNKGHVLIHKQQTPIIGIISMNLTVVDITHITQADVNDEVVLIGSEPGITASDVAQQAETIPIEITTRIHTALRRVLMP